MTEPHPAPTNLRSLTTRLDNLARQTARPIRRVQRTVANTVVGQMLPSGVMKGGAAMSVRVGEAASRFTTDLDAARHTDLTLDDYLNELAQRLDAGWGGFTGTLEQLTPAEPEGVAEQYVMQPFKIRLLYLGRHWLTVPFELGHDEIGSTKQHELRIAHDIVTLFESIGLPQPQPIPLLTVEHQIAQKLHACTSVHPRTGNNDRAHDLVDLQILNHEEPIDKTAVAEIATRLFRARNAHTWPPVVVSHPSWPAIYAEAADGLDVVPDVGDAVAWTNDFITSLTTE
jgi:hypothetical protein